MRLFTSARGESGYKFKVPPPMEPLCRLLKFCYFFALWAFNKKLSFVLIGDFFIHDIKIILFYLGKLPIALRAS